MEFPRNRFIAKTPIVSSTLVPLRVLKGKNRPGRQTPRTSRNRKSHQIMTLYVALELCRKRGIHKNSLATVSESAADSGTTAGLKKNDVKLWDLLHGLILPSPMMLAEHFDSYFRQQPLCNFISEMNQVSQDLLNTGYCNLHGLVQKRNLSTAQDTCKLAPEQ